MPAMMMVPVVMHSRHHDHARPDVAVVTMVVTAVYMMAAMGMVTVLNLHYIRSDFGLGCRRQRRRLSR